MPAESLERWRALLAEIGDLGDALARAIAGDDVVAAIAATMALRRARAELARVEAPIRLDGNSAELEALADVGANVIRARVAEATARRWLERSLPGDATLLASPLGIAALADAMLPAVWDFDSDVVVLIGDALAPVAHLLADLGQRRIVMWGCDAPPPTAIAATTRDEVAGAIRTMTPCAPARSVVRAALGTDREDVELVGAAVHDALADLRIHRNTIAAFSRTWVDQGAANLPAVARWPSIAALDGQLAGKPIVIVAPGPSLANNVAQLAELRGRAIVVAFSHSLRPVLAAGVAPDLVLTVDPQDVRYHFAGCDVSKSVLVNAATAHPSLFALGARGYLALSANCAIDDWIFAGLGEDAIAPGGGSVATTAFSLALRWRCDPIVFVGLDLSFPGGRYYVDTSIDGDARAVVDERGHVRVAGWSDGFRAMKASGGPAAPTERAIELPGWHGGTVPSSFVFSMFHRWFVERAKHAAGARVYNCTEGGAFIDGMIHRPLAGVLAELDAPFDAASIVDAAIAATDARARASRLAAHVDGFARAIQRAGCHARHARSLAAAGADDAAIATAERALADAVAPLTFASLLAQREIDRAHESARRPATRAGYLAASMALFDTVLDVIARVEPVVTAAAERLAEARDHECTA